MEEKGSRPAEVIKALGLVFGDIGTSPIYTLTVIFLFTPHTPENVLGVLSLIVWTLILLVTLQYVWLAMSLGRKGEGGTIVLRELLLPILRDKGQAMLVTVLSFIGVSLLVGDGVITPAISILSAVEGLRYVPGYGETGQGVLLFIAVIVAVFLFAFQRRDLKGFHGPSGP